MKKCVFLLLTAFALSSCSNDDLQTSAIESEIVQTDPLTTRQINDQINETTKSKGRFSWNESSSHFLWSGIVRGNKIASIGFGDSKDDFDRSQFSNSEALQSEILEVISKYEGKKDRVLMASDQYLNQIDVYIEKQETVIALRKLKSIRYFEPADYHYFENENTIGGVAKSSGSSSGCGLESTVLNSADYTTVSPNAKAPWSFAKHNITSAWNYSTGAGITIGLIDSGVSFNQTLLSGSFNNGSSSGRTISKNGVYVDSVWPWSSGFDGADDKCGHGTSIASAMAAPRNSLGQPVGVAYNANLVS
jgi:serine protease